MSLPVVPTIHSIVSDALKQANGMEYYSRARETWIEEFKREIADLKDWKFLEQSAVLLPVKNVQTLATPSDFKKHQRVMFYSGSETGTATAGGATSITLAANEDITQDAAEGSPIFLVSGTGSSQSNRITAYNTGTKVATVAATWDTNPASGSVYMIASTVRELVYVPFDNIFGVVSKGIPEAFSIFEKELYFNQTPDDTTYAVILHYYVDVSKVDLTDTRMVDLCREWRNALSWGVVYRAFYEKGDPRYKDALAKHEISVRQLRQADESRRRVPGAGFRSIGGMPHGNR